MLLRALPTLLARCCHHHCSRHVSPQWPWRQVGESYFVFTLTTRTQLLFTELLLARQRAKRFLLRKYNSDAMKYVQVSPPLQMRKLRLRGLKWLAHGRTYILTALRAHVGSCDMRWVSSDFGAPLLPLAGSANPPAQATFYFPTCLYPLSPLNL